MKCLSNRFAIYYEHSSSTKYYGVVIRDYVVFGRPGDVVQFVKKLKTLVTMYVSQKD